MFYDIAAVYWKECQELFFQGRRQILLFLALVIPLGIWLPYQVGHEWLQLPIFAVLALAVSPLLSVFSLVADSFAGERERHTLETLLATSLSNGSIVVGKIAVLLTLTTGITVISLLLGVVVANLSPAGHTWSFYPLSQFVLTILLNGFFAVLTIELGILVSLRATTVRQAQQIVSYSLLGLALVIWLLGSQIAKLPFLQQLKDLSAGETIALVISTLALIDMVLMLVILIRFQRSRLILTSE